MLQHDAKVVLFFAAVGYIACASLQCFACVPERAKNSFGPLPGPHSGALLGGALYGANIAYNVLNKRLLLAYPYPVSMTAVILGICSLFAVVVCALCGDRVRPRGLSALATPRLAVTAMAMVTLHYIGILCTNISIYEVNVSFMHRVRASEPLFAAIFSMVFMGSKLSSRAWLTLLLIAGGVAGASSTEVSFTWLGVLAAVLANISLALGHVLSKGIMDTVGPDPVGLTALVNCGAFALSLPTALLSHALCPKDSDWPAGQLIPSLQQSQVFFLLAIGPLFWMSHMASMIVLSWTSPVVHSMIRSLQRPVLVLASVVAFGTALTPLHSVGIAAALGGAWLLANLQ